MSAKVKKKKTNPAAHPGLWSSQDQERPVAVEVGGGTPEQEPPVLDCNRASRWPSACDGGVGAVAGWISLFQHWEQIEEGAEPG